MTKIWKKGSKKKINPIVEAYNTGDDYIIDMVIMPYDIEASKAQAQMLNSIGILKKGETDTLLKSLDNLMELYDKGKVEIRVEDEDCHTVIENYLIEELGDLGKKIHTGRSRNDQVLTAVRMYVVEQLISIEFLANELAKQFIKFAEQNKDIVLPGYSHTQQAMLSSVGHRALSFTEGLINDLEIVEESIEINNQNPLGTAAGFGVSFDLDRDMICELLGFEQNLVNSLFAQASRGKFESFALEAVCQVMMTLCRFATDILFFSSNELEYMTVDESLTTGSSIMPQKRNLDSMELLRANTSIVISHQLTMKNIIKGTISGYNRDLQLLKKPLIESMNIVQDSLELVSEYLESITINEDKINKSIKKEILAADLANELVENEKMTFRDAYQKVGKELDKIKDVKDYSKYIKSKKSLGSPGNLAIDYYKDILEEED